MKHKITCKSFFRTLGKRIGGALTRVASLLGYKDDTRLGRAVRWMFTTSLALLLSLAAVILLWAFVLKLWQKYNPCTHEPEVYYYDYVLSEQLAYCDHGRAGYIYDRRSKRKLLRHIAWIAAPMEGDSLVCFSDGRKRGYFNRHTGAVVIPPVYDHAWIFSDGLASVEVDGFIRFIDTAGNVVIDKRMPYIPGMQGYVFHGGYCVVDTDDGQLCGLMNRQGDIVLPCEYDRIYPTNDLQMWTARRNGCSTVFDAGMNQVIPPFRGWVDIADSAIVVTLSDHTMRKYDICGNLLDDFYIYSVDMLEYPTEEISYTTYTYTEDYGDGTTMNRVNVEPYHPVRTASLRSYKAGDWYQGLMTADGHTVTQPLYTSIKAVGPDLYLCEDGEGRGILLDGKGRRVK